MTGARGAAEAPRGSGRSQRLPAGATASVRCPWWSLAFSSSSFASTVALSCSRLGAVELLAGFPLGRALGVLRRGDLRLDDGVGAARDGAAEIRHRRVDDLGALLVHHREQRGVADLDGARDLAERRVGLAGVVDVEQRADEEPVGPADEHAERSADDADQQADQASGGRARHRGRLDAVLRDDLAVLASGDDDRLEHVDAVLGIELLEQGQRLVGIAVVLEGDRDDAAAVEGVGGAWWLGVLGVLVMVRMLGRTCVSARHAFLMIRRRPSALAQERQHRVDAAMLRLAGVRSPSLLEDPGHVRLAPPATLFTEDLGDDVRRTVDARPCSLIAAAVAADETSPRRARAWLEASTTLASRARASCVAETRCGRALRPHLREARRSRAGRGRDQGPPARVARPTRPRRLTPVQGIA